MTDMRKSTQFLTGIIATIGGFTLGNIIGWSSPAESKVEDEVGMTDDEFTWVASIMPIGAALSQIITAFLMDLLGRKLSIIFLSYALMSGWIILIFWKHFIGYLIGRLLLGFFAGGTCVVCPTLVGEISHKSIRGVLGSFFQLMIVIGILYSYCFAYVDKLLYFHIITLIFPGLLGTAMIFLPESPLYLLKRNKDEKAVKSLKFYRGPKYDIEPEMADLRTLVQKDETSIWNNMKKKESVKAFLMLLGLHVIQQLCGINAVMFYAHKIFEMSNTNIAQNISVILLGAVQVVATAISSVTVDRLGRKILWYISLSIMAFCQIFFGVYFTIYNKDKDLAGKLSVVPTLVVCLYIVGFSWGAGPLPWIIIGEILPTRIKSIVGPFCAFVNWMLAFLITITFPFLVVKIGIDMVYYGYGVICVLGIVFVFFCTVETKNKSLVEIQEILKGKPTTQAASPAN